MSAPTLIEAARAALDALERYQVKRQDFDRFADEITGLRAAIEAAESAKPAAWVLTEELDARRTTSNAHLLFSDQEIFAWTPWTPVWTHPPEPARQPMPDWLDYDAASDVLTINGHRYAVDLFGPGGLHGAPGTVVRIEPGPGDVTVATTLRPMTDDERTQIVLSVIATRKRFSGPVELGAAVVAAVERFYKIGVKPDGVSG